MHNLSCLREGPGRCLPLGASPKAARREGRAMENYWRAVQDDEQAVEQVQT